MDERIRTVRRDLGLTQAEFADRLNVSTRAVQTWEHGIGSPRPRTLRRIAALAEKPVAWFYEDEVAA